MFIGRFELFKAFGIPIRIDLSWFIIAIFLTWFLAAILFPQWHDGLAPGTYWLMGAAGALGLFVSVLLHELGHAITARNIGIRMNGITLFIFGGVAEMQDEPPSARDEFLVAIAGPIVSVAIAGVCGIAAAILAFTNAPIGAFIVTAWLGWINGVLVVFNMVPAFPLDGGRVLRSILWHWNGDLRWATRISAALGSAFGIMLIVLGVFVFIGGLVIQGVIWFLIGMFVRNAAQMAYQQVLIRRALEGEPVARFMTRDVITVDPHLPLDRLVNDYFYRHYHQMYPVVDEGRVVGCVTTKEVKQVPPEEWHRHDVASITRPCAPQNTIDPDMDAMEAMSRMSRNEASRMMVVDEDGRLVGIIALKDLLRFLSLKIELDERRHGGAAGQRPVLPPEPVNRMREFEESRR